MTEIANIKDYGYKDTRRLRKALKIIAYVLVALTIVLIYASTIMIALQSFNSSVNTQQFGGFTFKWYLEMFKERTLRNAIFNTLIVSLVSVSLSTILGTLIAIGIFSLSKKSKQIMILLNNIPLLNADMVTGISLMLVFSLLLPVFPYLFGPTTMILAHLFFTLPYVILSVLPKLKEIDKNLIDAALDLGVKPFRAIKKVIIPAISSSIFSGALLAFTVSVDDFVISYYTTGNGFDNLSIWIYSSIGRRSLTPSVYAFSTLLLIVTLMLIITSRFLMNRGKSK
ncbi:MAG: ABC transporter permease [Acholeplasmatales bacterium]|jgi:spermidine/putrescine transport system permease protein|nr:ABC transporter permease [Acholeplasmatales bacterium]